ncbi:hypothetical protein [Streptomyces pseudovenezuelae]|uniref:Lipoprotein n=1 Tax=Streptomyces pseudovenezuelae TaxID=67350 RepID=A0ABT6LWG0_9ACTN|nr:hypothetical protein [Streptomyces pseudovenezuelae]MDH6220558.1 hypothetical protein [Streptomyces pseudovenezuelae]
MPRKALTALVLATAATAALTACQSGQGTADSKSSPTAKPSKPADPFAGLSAAEIADRSMKATTGAESVRMKGDIQDEEAGGSIHVDMTLSTKNECAGTLGMGGTGKADLIKTGDTMYMKYDEAFLRQQSKGESKATVDATVAMLAGKWAKMSTKGADAEDIAGFCDLDSVLSDAEDAGSGGGSSDGTASSTAATNATRAGTAEVDGAKAAVLKLKDGKDRYTMYVATEGKPYLLRLDSTGTDAGSLVFSDYDKPVPVRKPTGQVLDLDALGS